MTLNDSEVASDDTLTTKVPAGKWLMSIWAEAAPALPEINFCPTILKTSTWVKTSVYSMCSSSLTGFG